MPEADTSTDLRMELAMQRLGLAAEMGGVMSFSIHEELRLALRDAALERPPPGYAKVSVHQLRAAHKEFWNQLSIRCEGKVAAVGGVKPLDALVPAVLASRQFEACLKYLPELAAQAKAAGHHSEGSAGAPGAAPGHAQPKKLSRADRKRRQLERAADVAHAEERAKVQKMQQQQPGQSRAQSSKGGGKGSNVAMPKLLLSLGCVAKTPTTVAECEPNESICYGYNLPGGCTNAPPGGKCGRGMHVCAKCLKKHPAIGNH